MNASASDHPPIGRAPAAACQIRAVVDHIRKQRDGARVHLVAHSWGTLAAGLFAGDHADSIGRLVFFGPLARRQIEGLPSPGRIGAWRDVSVADQLKRFVEDVPPGHPPVLIEPELADWGPAFLASDPDAPGRTPPAVRIPNGPQADIIDAMSGQLAYEPGRIAAPTLIVRGGWDSLCRDADAASNAGARACSRQRPTGFRGAQHDGDEQDRPAASEPRDRAGAAVAARGTEGRVVHLHQARRRQHSAGHPDRLADLDRGPVAAGDHAMARGTAAE
jgi:hypothetical protein